MDASGNTGPPQPVPQALYVNNSALAAAVPNIQLQNPYINSPIVSTLTAGSQRSAPIVASAGRTVVNTSVVPSLQTLPTASPQPGPPPALVPVSSTTPLTRHTIARAPPPYNPPPQQQATNQINRRPSAAQAPSAADDTLAMKKSLEIDAHQIRVGIRKYMPACSVVFKDDGVLFTLREYTNAPLLLNARAIQRCKANLGTVHPVMFFALEASCIKQIRAIFHMTEDEFSDKDPSERKRCITVFPKSLTPAEGAAITHSFNSMKAKFGRPDNILFPIDMDAAIDILYGCGERSGSSQSSGSSNTTSNSASSNNAARPITNGISNSARQHPYQRPMPQLPQHPQSHPQQMVQQRVNPPIQSNVSMNNMIAASSSNNPMMMMQYPTMSQAAGNRMPSVPNNTMQRYHAQQTQPIIIPQDQQSWTALKKTLNMNQVYQVIRPNDPSRRICHFLFNGSTFVPYQADTEIYLHCHNARVGSLRRPSAEPVIVKGIPGTQGVPGKLGIQFKIKMPEGLVNFLLYEDEISTAFMCFERICAMFIVPHQAAVQRIRNQCKMKGNKDPTYDPQSKEERQKHLILFLRQVSQTQKEDLLRLKRMSGGNNKSFFSEVDAMGALRTLSAIRKNTPAVQGRITDYLGGSANGMQNVNLSELESLAQELTQLEPAPPADDDDDDVIMTAEEVNTKCPYTQSEMKEPVRNKNCGHSYEKEAIIEFIARRRAKGSDKTAKCPYAGCGNAIPLVVEDLEENRELKEYIRRKQSTGN